MVTRLEFWPYPFLIGLILLGVIVAGPWGKRRRAYLACLGAFGGYLLALAGVTIFPVPIPGEAGSMAPWQAAGHVLSRVNLIPFYYGNLSLINPNVLRMEILQNILMTIPFGFGVPFVSRVKGPRLPWLALAVGVAAELGQFAVSLEIGAAYRSVDINDLLLNALGVILGYGIFRGLAWVYCRLVPKPRGGPGPWAYIDEVARGGQAGERVMASARRPPQ